MQFLKLIVFSSLFISLSSCGLEPFPGTLPQSMHPLYHMHNLVEIEQVDRTIKIDLQYKNSDNLTGKPLYRKDFPALLRPKTVARLKEANTQLKEKYGLKLKVWDAYRPESAHQKLWDASDKNPAYVSDPSKAPSKHSYGTAVDVTLVDLNGKNVPMPTKFDDFSAKSASAYPHHSKEVKANLEALQTCMSDAGFHLIRSEWWHFVDYSYRAYQQKIELE